MGKAPCGCRQIADSETADEIGRDLLRTVGVSQCEKWRCPARGFDGSEELDSACDDTAKHVENLVKAPRGSIKTCPRYLASGPDVLRALRMYRATQTGGVNFDDDPPAVLLHAVDTIAGADAARQEHEIEESKKKQ